MSFADFTMFFSAIRTFSTTISKLIGTIMDIGEDAMYIESFKKYMELENTIAVERDDDLHISVAQYTEPIHMRNMSFKYP
jgi:hypothetical protein